MGGDAVDQNITGISAADKDAAVSDEMLARIDSLRAEVERLKIELDKWTGAAKSNAKWCDEAQAERDRLRAEVERLKQDLEAANILLARDADEYQSLRAERGAKARPMNQEIIRLIDSLEHAQDEQGEHWQTITQIKRSCAHAATALAALCTEVEDLKERVRTANNDREFDGDVIERLEAERDAIEAKTIERCAQVADANGWERTAAAIRALANATEGA